ncbi:SGS domain-containing protein [Elsinoe fawcettii]|nr:SGS domain-containing protein [Elsinoe fawcettii]
MDHAKRGNAALDARNYSEAVEAYSQAIKVSPTAPDYYIKRSIAHQRNTPPDNAAALADAEQGAILGHKRAKREFILQAQLRRAIALFGLGQFANAKFVLDIVKRLDPKEKSLALWENKTAMKLAGLDKDDPNAQVTVKEIPHATETKPEAANTTGTNGPQATAGTAVPATTATTSTPAPVPVQTPANKIRHDWYQNNDNVIFTLLAKGVPKDKTHIDIKERSLTISYPMESGSDYEFTLDPLYAAIDPSQSKSSILSTKVEITLKKTQPGQKWHALESSEPVSSTSDPKPTPVPSSVLNPSSTGPSYPTSSRSGPKNWDKLAADLTSKKPKKENADPTSKDKKPAGEGKGVEDDDDWDYDKDDGDEVNGFFKKLYSGASDDVRKAMIKSYTESGGTALSTNWGEVQKGTVPVQPPDGMEARKWE